VVLKPKPPREVYALRLLHDLDTCHRRPLVPLFDLVNRRLDLVNTVHPPHVLLLADAPKCQSPWSVFRPSWSLGPSLMFVLHHS
jgi:hypothetical protein